MHALAHVAQVETDVLNYHDPTGELYGSITLSGTQHVGTWLLAHRFQALYASHAHFLKAVAAFHGAAW